MRPFPYPFPRVVPCIVAMRNLISSSVLGRWRAIFQKQVKFGKPDNLCGIPLNEPF